MIRIRGEFEELNSKQTQAEDRWLVFYSFIFLATCSWSGLEDNVRVFFGSDLFLEG